LATLLRLLAPFLPFATEEIWSWWHEGSVHRSSWPDAGELRAAGADGDPAVLDVAGQILSEIRKAKTEAKLSLKAPVERVAVSDTAERLDALRAAQVDVLAAGNVAELDATDADEFAVTVSLAPTDD
jgi:valyl-tRNA synthetase